MENRIKIDWTSPYTKPVCLDSSRLVKNNLLIDLYRSNDNSVIRNDKLLLLGGASSVHFWYQFKDTNQGNIVFKLKMRAKPGVQNYVGYLKPVRYKEYFKYGRYVS